MAAHRPPAALTVRSDSDAKRSGEDARAAASSPPRVSRASLALHPHPVCDEGVDAGSIAGVEAVEQAQHGGVDEHEEHEDPEEHRPQPERVGEHTRHERERCPADHLEDGQIDHELTFDAGIEFIDTNADADRWFVQIECFDPHEPFFTYDEYKQLYPHDYDGPEFDWPPYAKVTEAEDQVEHARFEYKALVSMCDRSLGRVLDAMDEHDMWEDTLLIVNTDHGFLLGEHGWWAKSVQPWFNELVHLPAFLWDPRTRRAGERSARLVQTIDIAPTLLEFFGIDATADMLGAPLETVERAGALFGIHGGHVNITDGRYVYMRACADPSNAPLEEYTLMPTHMRGRFAPAEFADAELASPFSFTKGVRPLRLRGRAQINPYVFGSLLFDLEADPGQERPLDDPELELRMLRLLATQLRENDAPASQFQRLGIPTVGEPGPEHLLVHAQRDRATAAAEPLPPLDDFAVGEFGIGTSVPELLAHPVSREVVTRHLPMLAQSELLGMLGSTTIYALAAVLAIPVAHLRAIADELAAI
ncbi:sulfatase-like hydrolase/transferase [Microbacterium gorillae]|uniref:sulfatase-like hydrolase/transferase n=1 Tax=Microbacterium gorillae TaxID=1231063 RepID=UPI003D99654A